MLCRDACSYVLSLFARLFATVQTELGSLLAGAHDAVSAFGDKERHRDRDISTLMNTILGSTQKTDNEGIGAVSVLRDDWY